MPACGLMERRACSLTPCPRDEDYYRHRAQLWEIQALSRTRPIAGHQEMGDRFQDFAKRLTDFHEPPRLAAYTPNWKQEIDRMRQRIEKERTPTGKQPLAIKTGAGGFIDAEFVAQTLCLANGWHEANTLRALFLLERKRRCRTNQRTRLSRITASSGGGRHSAALELRRRNGLPDDPAPLYRVAVRCGFTSADPFLDAVTQYRTSIRKVYSTVMEAAV